MAPPRAPALPIVDSVTASSSELLPSALRLTTTRSGVRIYTLQVDAYRALPVNVFVIVRGEAERPEYSALVDVGSERPACFGQILGGLKRLRAEHGEQVSPESLSRVILTHEHPDHVGGLPLIQGLIHAPLAAHPLAAESLRDPVAAQQRSLTVQEEVYRWLGVPPDLASAWLTTQRRPMLPTGVTVADTLTEEQLLDGFIRVMHVPGHAAGQVALGIDEVLLTADHLLPGSIPPLWPQRVRPLLGLSHYLHSLGKVERAGAERALPSHGSEIERPERRIAEVRSKVADKLSRIRAQIEAVPGQNIFGLAQQLYPNQPETRAKLLLSQTAALVEYLAEQNELTEHPSSAAASTWTRTP